LDWYGAVMRRKFVVLLLAALGALLGYIYYEQQAEVFASTAQVMIWSQTPSKIIQESEGILRNRTPMHENLIASQVVLDGALEQFKGAQLNTFIGEAAPVLKLKNMISVNKVDKDNEELLEITVRGGYPDELPDILAAVQKSYQKKLDLETRDITQESVKLIMNMEKSMQEKLEATKEKLPQLVESLGVMAKTETGEYINPHANRFRELYEQRLELKDKLEKNLRTQELVAAAHKGRNQDQLDVLVIEAKNYLGVDYRDERIGAQRSFDPLVMNEIRVLTSQLTSLDSQLMDLKFEYRDKAMRFGANSEPMRQLRTRIDYWEAELQRLSSRKQELMSQLVQMSPDGETDPVDSADPSADSPGAFDSPGAEAGEGEVAAPGGIADVAATDSQAESGSDALIRDDGMEEIPSRREQELRWITLYEVSLKREEQQLQRSLASVQNELEGISLEASQATREVEELNLQMREIAETEETLKVLRQQISQLDLSSDYARYSVEFVDPPSEAFKVAPLFFRCLLVGLFLGGMTGVGLALLIDRMDMSFRSPAEIFGNLGLPVVGRVPKIRSHGDGADDLMAAPSLVAAHKSQSVATEAFRAIRTAVFFAMNAQRMNTFLISSPSPGDGKTTICCNLAISMAQAGKRVLLLDGDFRRPRIHQYLGEENSPGITQVLNGEVELSEAVRDTFQENLSMLSTGPRPRNPGELVTSIAFEQLIQALKPQFDVILIDSPPVMPVADATVVSGYVDGVYLAMRIRKGVKVAAQRAKDNLEGVEANLLGVIVNGVDENPHYHEYGYYGYGHGGYGYNNFGYAYGYGDSLYGDGGYVEKPTRRISQKQKRSATKVD